MTTIVYRDGILAADTVATRGNLIEPDCYLKIHRLRDGRLFGWCGDAGPGVLTLAHFNNPKISPPTLTGDSGFALIVGIDGSLWTYEQNAMCSIRQTPFYAVGTGNRVAYGALAMGATAIKAVRIAAQFDTNTGSRVNWMRLR